MKRYKWQRYLFFWLSIVAYFAPYVVATAALLPFMQTTPGMRVGIGLAIVALNALPFIGGLLRSLLSHVPFVNFLAFVFLFLAGFFTLELFGDYVSTFMVIEACAACGSVAACVLWRFHRRYKRQNQTVATVLKSGVLEAKEEKR